MAVLMGHMGGLINPRPGRGQYRAGFSNTGGSPKPRKRAPCQKKNMAVVIVCAAEYGGMQEYLLTISATLRYFALRSIITK